MALRKAFEKRNTTYQDFGPAWERDFPSLFGGLKTFAGKKVSQQAAQHLIAVFACQSLIADAISTMPIEAYRQKKKGPVPTELPKWLEQPNPFQTSHDFWSRVCMSLLSDGNAFIATLRDDQGMIQALYCLDPTSVGIDGLLVGENTYTVMGERFDRSQILHIVGIAWGNRARGLSPIDIAREAIGLGLTAEEFGARFFAQGVTMSGVIEHPGVPQPSEARLLREMFKKNHGGTKNSHAVGILTGGAAFKPISITPEQAQFLETRKYQNTQIALLYRVPAYIVDPSVTSSWGTGIEEQNKFLVENTYMPWANRIEQAVSTFLLPGQLKMRFNFDARLRPKTKERYDAYTVAINNGFLSLDEVRTMEGLEAIADNKGAEFWRPAHTFPLTLALEGYAASLQLDAAPTDPAKPPDNPDGTYDESQTSEPATGGKVPAASTNKDKTNAK